MSNVCTLCSGPIEAPDTHEYSILCLGLAHAEAALAGSGCPHCEDLPVRVLRARRSVALGECSRQRPTAADEPLVGRPHMGDCVGIRCDSPPHPPVYFTEESLRPAPGASEMVSFGAAGDDDPDEAMSLTASERDWADHSPVERSEMEGQAAFQDELVRILTKAVSDLGRDITHVNVEVVPCTKVSVDIFNPIFSNGILRPSGHIVKCYHEVYPDFDELKMLLLEEDSDNYHIISPSNRKEFLFRLFKHMVLGGELCQYEDVIEPYTETAKLMYKDLVSVQKDPHTKEISVVTTILKVSAHDHGGLCYPSATDNEQTFAYLCIDPFKRHVYVLYHSFGIGDFSGN
ncbi:hypothetical protein DPX16_13312 [Anabarilius grahami]|uniref:Cilia- and flagella-associated protein 300 n=1 Tax=Anabarilius grahami TaxID=495550 RepID=A0A3N0YN12_ANAGA|nr:hypothetical protein DPX16_13312 [Anabarilius grahami]